MWETWVQSLGWEDSLEKGAATHSSIPAWRIPWSVWGHKKSDMRDIPGGPAAKALCSQCRGPGFDPWSGNLIPHAAAKARNSQINK